MTSTLGVLGAIFGVVIFLHAFLSFLLRVKGISGLSYVDSARAKRRGGLNQLELFDEALSTGVVPPNADRAKWSHELDPWNLRRVFALENLLASLVILAGLWEVITWMIPKSFHEILLSHRTWWVAGYLAAIVLLVGSARLWQRLRHRDEPKVNNRKRLRQQLKPRPESAAYNVIREHRSRVRLSGRRSRS
ncbi:MAG: hypothetical protein JWQ70_2313 [Aeromicrobium sp.]|nr:hypothetical protein [Aeromicrobium sp.]